MVNLLRSEIFRAQKRFQSWLLLGIILLGEIVLYGTMVIVSIVRTDPDSVNRNIQLPKIYDTGLIIVNLVGTILVTIFAASLMGNEYSWNTLRPLLARSKSRASLLTAKWLTSLFYVGGLVIASVVAVYGLSALGSVIVGVDTGFSGSTITDAIEVIARYGMAMLPYAALGMLMSVLTKSNTAGIALSIALLLLEPALFAALGALSDVFDSVQKGGLSWNADRLFSFGDAGSDVTAGQVLNSAGVLAIWIIGFVLISFRVFGRRDVTSG
jgi:ABC-type transport system involved in multi-copper enzyme maturation permease subunit